MQLVLVLDALTVGGAETFVLRLGAALQKRGITVSLVVLRGDLVNMALCRSIAPNVPVLKIRVPGLRWALKLDGFLYRLGSTFSIVRWYQVRNLTRHIADLAADVAHSHLLTADLVTVRACKATGTACVSTMHGDYLALESRGESRAARVPDFGAAIAEVELGAQRLVSITDQQTNQLARLMPQADAGGRISKIYNGYPVPVRDAFSAGLPDTLRAIPEGAFVIGMVSRGVKDKGWDVLVGAFEALDLPDAWLVLVGDGDHLQKLRATNRNPRIVFCGNVVDPLRYIAHFEVACLPSQFATESLPTVVIEYMVLGKPVIATDVGEIPAMLEVASDSPAGLLVELGETTAWCPACKQR